MSRASRTDWPATLAFGLMGLVAAGAVALVAEHFRPHPDDLRRLEARLSAMDLHIRAIRRTRAIWHLHSRWNAWRLSRFTRFYRVEAETDDGEPRQLYAAFDPWRARQGMQII